MQAPTNPTLEEKPFELSTWAILTTIGCVRILKDILQDLFMAQRSQNNLLIDVPLLLVFLLLLFLILKGSLRAVPLWVGIVLLLLTTWSFIRLGGVEGSSEYNFMALAVMFTLCYRGRDLTIIVSALFLCIVIANVDQMQHGRITIWLFKAATDSYDSFYTSVIVIGIVLLYFKEMLKVETSKVRHVRKLLGNQRSLIRKQHEELLQQQAILYEVTKRLGQDVKLYEDVIREQDETINNYIFLSTQNLRLSISHMKSIPSALPDSESLANSLKEEINALNLVVANLITDLENPSHDHLN
ncbi:MAG TPA: hypothetical protein VK658_27385 [Chryseolinea sp.]|nr:hypothetical protein [Chryseolinea sp.]